MTRDCDQMDPKRGEYIEVRGRAEEGPHERHQSGGAGEGPHLERNVGEPEEAPPSEK